MKLTNKLSLIQGHEYMVRVWLELITAVMASLVSLLAITLINKTKEREMLIK